LHAHDRASEEPKGIIPFIKGGFNLKKTYNRLLTFLRYRELFFLLVTKEIKLKYRRSILGYFWSVLNPLLIMIVMVVVFSNLFRPNIQYFPVYLLIGHMLFTYMNVATSRSLTSIIDNAAMLKKIYVPKYIYTLSVVTSELITLLFMLGALVIVILATGVPVKPGILFIIIPIIQLYIFCIGAGLFLAQATVFFRDIIYIWSIVTTAWLYLSAIFYPVSILPEKIYYAVTKFNPMYFYITMFRNFVFNDFSSGNLELAIRGAAASVIMLFLGLIFFSYSKKKFILYI
jgi:lipopolysaccharide transport system permease protein